MDFWICATCAVEHSEKVDVCAICADERQWVPASGQQWTTFGELAGSGCRTRVVELEPGLFGITSDPNVGIGQQSKLLCTPAGNLLWDPIGYLDDPAVRQEMIDLGFEKPEQLGALFIGDADYLKGFAHEAPPLVAC